MSMHELLDQGQARLLSETRGYDYGSLASLFPAATARAGSPDCPELETAISGPIERTMCDGQHHRPVTRGLLITLSGSALIAAAPWWITAILLGLPLIVLAAIFLPAVWSRRAARRRAARLLSERILSTFGRRHR